MQVGQALNLLDLQTLDFGVRRISVQRHLGLHHPLAQRFGINGEQTATFGEGKTGHEKDSFQQTAGTI
jgi:hypothetical protein